MTKKDFPARAVRQTFLRFQNSAVAADFTYHKPILPPHIRRRNPAQIIGQMRPDRLKKFAQGVAVNFRLISNSAVVAEII